MADPTNPTNHPKIIVDSDWKSQAQAEKERLAAAERKTADKPRAAGATGTGGPSGAATGAGAGGASGKGRPTMPPADFTSLVGTLVTQALMYLGGFPDPETGRAYVSLEHARFHIDLLGVLEQKTKGNLTPDEAQDLTQALHELRLRFVEISKAVASQMAQPPKPGREPGPPIPGMPIG